MPIYKIKAPNGKIYDIEAPANATDNELFGRARQLVEDEEVRKFRKESTGFFETAKQGAVRGAEELVSTGKDVLPALGASLFGFDEYAKEKLEKAKQEREAREAERPPLFRSYKEIEGVGDFGKYVTEKTSEQLANLATALVPGMGFGAAASRTAATAAGKKLALEAAEKGLAGDAAAQFIQQGLRATPEIAAATLRGEAAGTFLGSYALNAPEVFQNIYENNDGQLAPAAAALFSIGSAALDSILPTKLASQLPNPFKAAVVGKVLEKSGMDKSLVANITAGALKAAGVEGLTEGAQEAISIAAERFVSENPKIFGSKEWDRIMESAVAGAVSGGALGSVGGGSQALRARAAAKRQEAEQARIRGEEQLAQQREAEAAQLEQAAQAASTEIEALQRPTTELEQEAYGVEAQAGPYSPVAPYGPITSKEYKKQEAQINKDRQELVKLFSELAPEKLDLVSLAERPPAIEQTLRKAEEPLEKLQERGMRKGELNLEEMRRVGWNEEWNALVPNIAELSQPEFRKALTSDVTIPVDTRRGIIESAKQLTLPDGKPIIPKTARYSYPDASSTKIDDLRKISKDVFGVAPNAMILRDMAGRDIANPEDALFVRDTLDAFANSNKAPVGAADKIEKFLQLPQFKALEGAPSATGIDEQAGGEGAGVPSKRTRRPAPAPVESVERGRVDALTGDAGQPVAGETPQPGALETQPQAAPTPAARQLTPEQEVARAEAEFLGEEQVPIEERGAVIRRKKLTPEETKALEAEGVAAAEGEAAAVKPLSKKEIAKAVDAFFGSHYLDREKKLFLPKYEGPAFDKIQARLAEAGDLNGLLRHLLDTNKDPAIKQVLRRIRSLNLKTKLEIGDPSTGVYFNQFYSALFRAVSQIPNKSATPEEWRGIIRGLVIKGTVKADEVFWTGLDDWLASKKDVADRLEKKELVDYLNSHGIFIDVNELSGDETKYGGYDTPGGDNYREILPYLPEVPVIASNTVLRKEPDEKSEVLEKLPEGMFLLFDQENPYLNNVQQFRFGKDAGLEWVKITPLQETDENDTGLKELQPGWVRASDIRIHQELKFLTRHWPSLINPLGHIRINTRYDAEGNKILFVEEIQSDWAQQAKKTGFVSKEKYDAANKEIKKLREEEAKLNAEFDDSLQETGRLRAELEKKARKKSQTFYKYMTDKYGAGNPILAMQMMLHPQINPNWFSVSASLRNTAEEIPMYLMGNKHSIIYKSSAPYRGMFDVLTKIAEIKAQDWDDLSNSKKEALHFDVLTVLKKAMEEIPYAKEETPKDFTTASSRARTGALAAKTLADKFFADFFERAFYAELQFGDFNERDKNSVFLPEEITKLQNKIKDNQRNEYLIDEEVFRIRGKLKEKKQEQEKLTVAGPYIGIPKRAVIVPITEEVTEIDARTGKPKPRTKEIGYKVRYGKEEYEIKDKQEAQDIAESLNAKKEVAPSSEGWMNLALKQIALMAVKEGYDKVAFIDWNRSHERFPMDRKGNPTANLFSTLYGDTTGNQVNSDKPSLLKQGLQKLLNNWKGSPTLVRPNIGLSLRKGESRELTPNNAEVFVGKVLVEPYIGYGNQDRYDVEDRPEIIFRKGHKLTLKDVNDIREHIVRGEQLSASLVIESDGFFDALGFDVTPAMQDKISQGLPYMYGKSGSYDPRSDTIILDPELGMNAHTFIHEVVHAAISNVLRNKSHPLTKEFENFFVSIKDRLGDAYGGTDLQEFAAELISNPSFQATLKAIKAPRSENLFQFILRKIAEFFGFARGTTAFDRGINFVNAAIDVTEGIEPTPGELLFLTGNFKAVNGIQSAMPALVGDRIERARNTLSNITGSSMQEAGFGLLRLDNLRQIFGKELPSIKLLQDLLEQRMGRQEADTKRINDTYKRFVEVQQRFPEQMKTLSEIAIKASQAEVDILKPYEAKKPDAAKRVTHSTLQAQFKQLNPEVRGVYETARNDYDTAFKQYRKLIEDAAENMPGLAAKLKEEFERAHPLVGYVPFRRYGDFWLEFTNPETDAPVAMAFESIRERQKFIDENMKGIDHRVYKNFESIQFNADRVPPTHFISKVITGLRQNNASEAQVNAVYQAYLAAFPAESIAKQFMKRRGIEGMSKDFVRDYGDLMMRWSRKLANSEYLPKIDQALSQIRQEAGEQAPNVQAAAQSILRQTDFFHNPTFGTLVNGGTALSFYEFMAGNISSGIINLTSLPLMVLPLLTGKFGFGAGGAIVSAMKTATNQWQNDPKYKALYTKLMEHGQLEHTMAREVLEGSRKSTNEYSTLRARFEDLVALPFSVSEKFNRATTAIAAYDLELAKTGNKEAAIQYALDTVREAHTSGMAVTGPRWLQTPFGRLFGTFKSIIWQQAYIIARAFYQAAKGENKEIRDAARAQLLATYGMATVFVGVKGMPFYGAMSVMAQMLNALFGDDDEPFDLDNVLRESLPMILYKGMFNYLFNIELSNRAAIATDLIFRDDPRGIADHGYALSALQQAFGPVGSVLVNTERSIKMFKDGYIERAIETAAPATIRNALKGVRYLTEGALTVKGDPIDTDISAYNGLMQIIGFAPADLSNTYESLAAGMEYQRKILDRRDDALRLYQMAVRSGDMDLLDEVRERIQKFNEANPRLAITSESLEKSNRATAAAQQSMISGVRFNKKLLPEIQEKFFNNQ